MIAVKLHKKAIPWLGKGSHLIPIVSWRTGKIQIRNWIAELSQARNTLWPNNSIRFLTLVQIPDDHLVRFRYPSSWVKDKSPDGKFTLLHSEWVSMPCISEFLPMRDIWLIFLDTLSDAQRNCNKSGVRKPRNIPGLIPDGGGPMIGFPELILGEKLPLKCIKWTKDIDVLYGKSRHKRRRQRKPEADDE